MRIPVGRLEVGGVYIYRQAPELILLCTQLTKVLGRPHTLLVGVVVLQTSELTQLRVLLLTHLYASALAQLRLGKDESQALYSTAAQL